MPKNSATSIRRASFRCAIRGERAGAQIAGDRKHDGVSPEVLQQARERGWADLSPQPADERRSSALDGARVEREDVLLELGERQRSAWVRREELAQEQVQQARGERRVEVG